MPKIFRADGSVEDMPKKPTLAQLQKAVGGYIEMVRIPDSAQYLYVNEEGRVHGLPPNLQATALALQNIVGDVVLMRRGDERRGKT